MGLFEINMPLLYGEGRKAFMRRQKEILKESADHSIVLWPFSSLIRADGLTPGCLATSADMFTNPIPIVPRRGFYKQIYMTKMLTAEPRLLLQSEDLKTLADEPPCLLSEAWIEATLWVVP